MLAFAGAVVVLVAVAVLVGAIGGWTGRPLQPAAPELPTTTSRPQPSRSRPPPTVSQAVPNTPGGVAAWVWLLIAAVVALIVYLLLRRAWDARRRITESRRLLAEPEPTIGAQFDEEPPPAPQAPQGRQFDARAAADAIVSCWVWVEDWAAARGLPRLSFETPTEFLDRVIERPTAPVIGPIDVTPGTDRTTATNAGVVAPQDDQAAGDRGAAARAGADPAETSRAGDVDRRAAAAQILLPLYQRARFDVEALDPESAVRARDAALTVCGRDRVDSA